MRTLLTACIALVCCSGSTFAADIETFNFSFVSSEDVQGSSSNFIETRTASSSFTVGDVNWSGIAEAFADDSGDFLTFAGDLQVRIQQTSAATGDRTFFDLMLGHGASWHGPRSFTGSSPHMRGWQIDAGDELSFEFFEGYHDNEFADALWNSLDITFTDDNNVAAPIAGPVPDGSIRVRAIGQDSFPVTARNSDGSAAASSRGDGAFYWQVIYGPDASGTLPKLTGVKYDLGDPSVMSFDRSALEGEPSNFFTDPDLDPVSPDGLSIQFTNPDPDFGSAFGAMELLFDPNAGDEDFLPGGFVAIGWDIDGAPFDGADLADLAEPIQITLTFDDGTTSTAALDTRGYQGLFDVAPDGEPPLFTGMQYGYADIPVISDLHGHADFNHDGIVNGDDFLIWQSGFGNPGGHDEGDANNDGVVNGDDFLIWQAQFGGPPPQPGSGAGTLPSYEVFRELVVGGSITVIPEPASIALLAFGLVALAGVRRR